MRYFLIFTLLLSQFAFSQFILPTDSIWSQVESRYSMLTPDTVFDSPYNKWQRLKGFWAHRLGPSGRFKDHDDAVLQYVQSKFIQNNNIQQSNINFGIWQDLGPSRLQGYPLNNGRVTRIEIDKDDLSGNTVYALSPVGGIFKTTSAMTSNPNWTNFHTDNFLGFTSISDIRLIKDPVTTTKYLYAAFGGDGEFPTGHGPFLGIWRYNMTTNSWEDLTGNLTCPDMLGNSTTSHVRKMLIDPNNLSKIYLATSKGLYYTCPGVAVCGIISTCANSHLQPPIFPVSPSGTITAWQKASLNEDLIGIDFDYLNGGIYCSGRQIWHTTNPVGSFACISSVVNASLSAFDNGALLPTGTPSLAPPPNFAINSFTESFIAISTSSVYPSKLFASVCLKNSYTYLNNNNELKLADNSSYIHILKFDILSNVIPPNTFTLIQSYQNFGYSYTQVRNKHFIHVNPYDTDQLCFNYGIDFINIISLNNLFVPVTYAADHNDCHDFNFTNNNKIICSNDGGVFSINLNTNDKSYLNGYGLHIAQIEGFDVFEKNELTLIGRQDAGVDINDSIQSSQNWTTIKYGDGQSPLFTNEGNAFVNCTNTGFEILTNNLTQAVSIPSYCGSYNTRWNSKYKSLERDNRIYLGNIDLLFNSDPANTGVNSCNPPWYTLSNYLTFNGINSCLPANGVCVSDFDVSPDHKTIYLSYMSNGAIQAPCDESAIRTSPLILKSVSGGSNNPNVNPPCSGVGCWTVLGSLDNASMNQSPPIRLIGYVNAICMNPANPDQVWMGTSGYSTTISSNRKRMIYSTDGGNTFVDFSQGLPNFPVNEIILRKGSNYELFAATDVGVYYRNNTMTQWESINNNLPDGLVTDIKIDYCNNKLYAGTYGRGLWSLDLPPPVNPLALTTITLSNNNAPITYSTTQYFFNNILVKAGSIVQFSNTNIYMGPNTKITVEPGAILRIDASTVQSYCDKNMWEGIHCLGTASVSHQQSIQQNGFYSAHGRVYIHNNSLIKDAARAAVFLDQGGVVQAYDSRFENNRKDLEFHIFTFPNNHSIAQNCVFETNADTKKVSNGIDSHVTAWAVDGVTFRGCTFQNIAPPGSNNNNLGNGIGAEDAFLKIDNYCQSNYTVQPQPNNHTVFKNLAYGIYAQGATSNLRSFYVRNTDFENCQRGAYIKNMDWAKFQFCDFKIPSDQLQYGPYVLNSPYGLYFDNCQNFFCENNKFTGLPGLQLASAATGVYVNNSNANATRVYNCDFTNLQVGSAGLFDNYYESITNSESVGLRFNCNKYTECNYDVAVMGGAFNYVPTNIDNVQGSWTSFPSITDFSKTVRNLYSAICQINDQNQYYNDKIVNGQYIHYNQAVQLNNGGNYFTQPQNNCFDQNKLLPIPLYPQFPFIRDESSCPTSGIESGAPCLDCNLAALNVNISNLKSQIVTETAKLTGAASQTLISLINSNISNGDLINVLITQSPLLSDPVLLAYFNKAGIPPGHIKQVHGLNAPVSEAVWQVIDNLNLPPGIENQIIKAQMAATQVNGGLSGRRNFEANVSSLKSQATYLLNEKTRIFLSDSIERNVDSLKVIIQNPIYADRDLKLLDFYISTAQYSLASSQNSQIALRRGTSYAPYNNVKSMIISALSSTSGLSGLSQDATIEGYLHSLANTDFSPGQKEAQALSDFVFDKKYLEYTLLPEVSSPDGSRPMKEEQKEKSPITDNPKLNAIPNPASDDVVIQYQLPQGANYGILKVLDITGREVYKTDVITSLDKIYLSTKDWANGMYYYSLTVNNQIIGVKTIVIAK